MKYPTHFWSKGYSVNTIGLDENKIRRHVKYQANHERIEEQQRLDFGPYRGLYQVHLLGESII
ncbi:MAG: hypothetical protein RBR30_01800 [Tenuifilaceae bacterium]|nr:hypothetical protein [Tenuifilaceae bacterium]